MSQHHQVWLDERVPRKQNLNLFFFSNRVNQQEQQSNKKYKDQERSIRHTANGF